MLFKYPAVLFFLFLLLIPLLIHLFQLQKFQKEFFTNVKFLKEIELKSRRSSTLKKWLMLITRMLTLAALVFAFARPFLNKNQNLQPHQSFFYIDNSLSLQATTTSGIDKLQFSKNMLIDKLAGTTNEIGLLSNEKYYGELAYGAFKDALLQMNFYPVNKDINQVLLEIDKVISKKTNTLIDVYIISDFQSINGIIDTSLMRSKFSYNLVDLSSQPTENIALDSVWLADTMNDQLALKARISSAQLAASDLSVSLFLNEDLFGKTSLNIEPDTQKEIEFLIPDKATGSGKLIMTDHRLNFDNELFFVLPEKNKSKVLVIGASNKFLERIYDPTEFELTRTTAMALDQSTIMDQDLVILNELADISKPLSQVLKSFVRQRGNLVVIPSNKIEINSYNDLFQSFGAMGISGKFEKNKRLTGINYQHPFFKDVFEEEVYNFQYPRLTSGYVTAANKASSLLQFEDQTDFVSEIDVDQNKVFWIASPLSDPANEFVNSPLIVPLFYNFSTQGTSNKGLYLNIGQAKDVKVPYDQMNDHPVKVVKDGLEFIPFQSKSNKMIRLTFEDYPLNPGIYEIRAAGNRIQEIAFNHNRIESDLTFNEVTELAESRQNIHLYKAIEKAIDAGNERNNNKELWQLFVIFALVFLVLEILLQKFLKN